MDKVGLHYLSKAINDLRTVHNGDRFCRILYLRFWEKATLEDISKELKINKSYVRVIEAKALRLLKKKLKRTEFHDYLDHRAA
jgi:DNA-directed RNA polymerase sigma subunit (sigma70/sigma32)